MNLYHNEEILVQDIYLADSFFKRFRGYMFHKKPHYPGIVLFPCNSIHMFFMNFDLDVLFLDEDMTTIKVCHGLKKNQVIHPVKKARYTIEAPKWTFKDVDIGDKLNIK